MAGPNSGRVIPREELSEFQRWQFSTLLEESARRQVEEPRPVDAPAPQLAAAAPVPETADVAVTGAEAMEIPPETVELLPLPTAEEIEAIERQAQEEGYQSGLAAGRIVAEAEVGRLRALLDEVAEVCCDAEVRLADEVLDLALVIARQMVREELRIDRTMLLPAIREAIAGLPQVKGPSRLQLNPDDLTAVSALLAGEFSSDYWRFVPDPSLPAGSCRIETPVSVLDLTLATRWQSLLRVLGRTQRSELAWSEEDVQADSDHA